MPGLKAPLEVEPARETVRGLIIVSRNQPELWHALIREFGRSEEIRVILDRRHGERRKADQLHAPDRRGTDRRNLPRLEDDVRSRQYVLVRPHYRTPRD
jgi:hypothetical protein